ncbi:MULTISPECIES: S4 domain-containing protein YaaA [Peptoniphilus]|uniref:Ribosome-associated protein n=1 Tax=Peptoniphilus harei TaxID=54005 RepID=A0A2X1XWF9_9FIRM|nr:MULTISPECIES: S4 domain-containing protein YaaA [Peptoniphilus]MBS6535188.1 S4 domain-containing protein YaaA [Peptoniphilus harei]MDU1641963.1 S4 domain-containing protein YaaA [Peptoniphilus harei]MDU2373067.1 S4 domain-containing protein YaaA [Peptoniphilus harei]MDU3086906.1 S4 domain-containing protein YaaA [Peptoniphilus harei]MDU5417238.1 S4 domain-containing protein YaaA [Peptoniphilus harei]
METIKINTEFIKLDSFLKLTNLCESGGLAKTLIQEGAVMVNGEVETRRGKKLYKGDKISFEGNDFIIGEK